MSISYEWFDLILTTAHFVAIEMLTVDRLSTISHIPISSLKDSCWLSLMLWRICGYHSFNPNTLWKKKQFSVIEHLRFLLHTLQSELKHWYRHVVKLADMVDRKVVLRTEIHSVIAEPKLDLLLSLRYCLVPLPWDVLPRIQFNVIKLI